ncbi:hypothetical protein ACHAPI_003586 [Fusarium lateritium]
MLSPINSFIGRLEMSTPAGALLTREMISSCAKMLIGQWRKRPVWEKLKSVNSSKTRMPAYNAALSETHDAISTEPWTPGPQDSIRLPAHAPEGFQLPSFAQEKPKIPRYTVKNGA